MASATKTFLSAILLSAASAAFAAPPFLTDDPEPTETGRWEIYGPLVEVDGIGSAYSGAVGVEVNYGAAPNLQLTVALPVDFAGAGGVRAIVNPQRAGKHPA